MEKGEIVLEKPAFGRGKDFIALVDRETKKRKIRWKANMFHRKVDKYVFIANFKKKGVNLKLQEELGYLSLSVYSPNDQVETFNAITDPSLNSLFARVEYIYLRKMKKLASKRKPAKV